MLQLKRPGSDHTLGEALDLFLWCADFEVAMGLLRDPQRQERSGGMWEVEEEVEPEVWGHIRLYVVLLFSFCDLAGAQPQDGEEAGEGAEKLHPEELEVRRLVFGDCLLPLAFVIYAVLPSIHPLSHPRLDWNWPQPEPMSPPLGRTVGGLMWG